MTDVKTNRIMVNNRSVFTPEYKNMLMDNLKSYSLSNEDKMTIIKVMEYFGDDWSGFLDKINAHKENIYRCTCIGAKSISDVFSEILKRWYYTPDCYSCLSHKPVKNLIINDSEYGSLCWLTYYN